MAEARQAYRPGVVPQESITLPTRDAVSELVGQDTEIFRERVRQQALATGVTLDNPDGLYDAAVTYMRFNRRPDARLPNKQERRSWVCPTSH